MKLYYNNDGWVCNIEPYNLPIENEDLYIEVSEDVYKKTLSYNVGMCWRVVKGVLKEEIYDRKAYQFEQISKEICDLRQEIIKAKEDVEQVELFGMERSDYTQKKARCVEIIQRLRVLEARLEELKEGD